MRIVKLAAGLVIAALLLLLIIYGKNFLIPLVIAIVVTYLYNAIAHAFDNIKIRGKLLPVWLRYLFATVLIGVAVYLVSLLVGNNIDGIRRAAPSYQLTLENYIEDIMKRFSISELPTIESMVEGINIPSIVNSIFSSATTVAGNTFLILVYMIFLLIEQRMFRKKIDFLFTDAEKNKRIKKMIADINESIMSYVSIKTFVSLLTGFLSYAVLLLVGVDFASFWALLIFFLNYIPSVGSLLATTFPVLLALVQFPSPKEALIVLIGILAIQTAIGNFLEPRLLGNKLNISPFVVILSLTFWGMLWGVPGMFLCVPITVIMMIVFNNIKTLKPIAVLLSDDGQIDA